MGAGERGRLTERVRDWIRKYDMIQTEDLIVVGLSGGGDSVCLLCVLRELAGELGFSLAAFHVHHGIRGREADRDAAFCLELCEKMGIYCQVAYVDVPAAAARRKQSLEEAARQERYRELENFRRQMGAQKIAVAHHRDDNAETVLWNLFRGSGLKGLAGMEPVNGYVIRPLLAAGREEIIGYLKERGIDWCLDETNESDDYTRNRIRHHLLSYAGQEINSQAARHVCAAAAVAAQADKYLRGQAAKWLAEHSERENESLILDLKALRPEEEILQSYVIREAVCLCGGLTDVTTVHVNAVRSLMADAQGAGAVRQVSLPGGLKVRRSYDILSFDPERGRAELEGPASDLTEEIIDLSDGMETVRRVELGTSALELQVISYDKTQKIPSNRYTKWMDYDKIERTLAFRTRRPGDFFLLPDGHRKTVKSYMIDEKIPVAARDGILLAAQGSHVLWIVGYRLCESVKVTADTKKILQIHVYGGKEDGKDSCIDSGRRSGQKDQ